LETLGACGDADRIHRRGDELAEAAADCRRQGNARGAPAGNGESIEQHADRSERRGAGGPTKLGPLSPSKII
jgi:hypothetical protein